MAEPKFVTLFSTFLLVRRPFGLRPMIDRWSPEERHLAAGSSTPRSVLAQEQSAAGWGRTASFLPVGKITDQVNKPRVVSNNQER